MRTSSIKLSYILGILVGIIVLYITFGSVMMIVMRKSLKRSNQEETESGKKPNIICLIDTYPAQFKGHATSILITWAKRCDVTYFVTSKNFENVESLEKTFKFIEYKGHDSEHWGKVVDSLDYVWAKHQNDMEWVLKVADDSFVVPENLRHFIEENDLNPSDPIWFGSEHYGGVNKTVYMSRLGYVLSKAAIGKIIDGGKKKDKNLCDTMSKGGNEEMELSKCTHGLKIKSVDTRDNLGRHRFLTTNIGEMLVPIYQSKNKRSSEMKYPYQQGSNCCAEDPILLIGGSSRFFDFMLYELRYAGEK